MVTANTAAVATSTELHACVLHSSDSGRCRWKPYTKVLTLHAFSRLQVKMAQPYRDEEGRCPYDMLLREGQVHCELSVVDPSNQYAPGLAAWSGSH
jgi:hypothetical protein